MYICICTWTYIRLCVCMHASMNGCMDEWMETLEMDGMDRTEEGMDGCKDGWLYCPSSSSTHFILPIEYRAKGQLNLTQDLSIDLS